MQFDLSMLRKWQPSERERQLLKLLLCLGFVGSLHIAQDRVQTSISAEADAHARLYKVRAQMGQLSNKHYAAFLAEQHRELVALTMNDPTKPLSDLRMREELTELALRAGLSKISVADVAESMPSEVATNQPKFSALRLVLEADFDWTGLVRLAGQIEEFYRGYLIDGIEVRSKGELRQMRITLRILHEPRGQAK